MSLNLEKIAYRVETERLLLRCWSPADAPAVRAAMEKSQAHLRPWITFMKDEPRSLADTVDRLRQHRAEFDQSITFRFGVFLAGTDTLVGENLLLTRQGPEALEVGYLTHLGFERKGYALEASAATTRLAIELYGARRVEIHHAAENVASGAIPKRLGFAKEAVRRDHIEDTEGKRHDCVIWCLHSKRYKDSSARQIKMSAFDVLGEQVL